MFGLSLLTIGLNALGALACAGCGGPQENIQHNRLVRRMQPEALNATTAPKGPLEWGQLNFLHTTDTHGWLEGHLKEGNYGADWGDYVSFVKHMREKADHLGVDLLVVDTGDLHDGNGLSDVTSPNGVVSNEIFSEVEYDLLTIGNHELYVTEIAYETFANFSKTYGDRYLTSNVQIMNKESGDWEDIGHKYRYFLTKHGLRIMSFGVLFDFDGNSNVSKITFAEDMIKEKWFTDAVNFPLPIDLFLVIGHNPIRANVTGSTLQTVHNAIREMRPEVPIQIFGGHQHIRDFTVYDEMSTGLASGRYCETLGWMAMTGIESPTFFGEMKPRGVPNPDREAQMPPSEPAEEKKVLRENKSTLRYARRYLDWNRLTFAYHAAHSQDADLDTRHGVHVTHDITDARHDLNITYTYGCAPRTYCIACKPFGDEGSIYTLLTEAYAKTVVNKERADIPRFIITNTGSVRFDLVQGPFTLDDSFIVSPFKNPMQYIPDVPYEQASQVIDILNSGPNQRRWIEEDFVPLPYMPDVCVNPPLTSVKAKRDTLAQRPITRREIGLTELTPGYTTTDDFGTDGDDTPHSTMPFFEYPNDIQANASFPDDGTKPDKVDVVFVSFLGEDWVLPALNEAGASYTVDDIQLYMPEDFTSNLILPRYAQAEWQENMPNCPVGGGTE